MPTMPADDSRRPWLFNAPLDLLIGCGAWSLPLLALTFWWQRDPANAASLALAFYALGVFCNNPHYMATLHRAYHTAEDFHKYRFFTIYVTALLVVAVVLLHLAPGLSPWVITAYITWSPWHYSGQNFGIAQLMLRRAGAPSDTTTRQLLFYGYIAAYLVWFATLHASRPATDPSFISLNLPDRLAEALRLFGTIAFIGCNVAAFSRLARTLSPRALIAPALLSGTQALWFVLPALVAHYGQLDLPAGYFSAGVLAFMHCAQYLWITTYYARRGTTPDKQKTRPAFSFARYYALLVIGGIALFVPGPWIASRLLGHDFVDSFLIFMALVNLHHFILDGAVWKLRDGRLARLLLGQRSPGDSSAETALANADTPPRHHLGWLFGPTHPARIVRLSLAGLILAVGAVDQWQYASTTARASGPALSRAALVNPADPRPAFRRAQLLAANGDTVAARNVLAKLVAEHPRNLPAQHLLGELLFKSGDTVAALNHYDHLATIARPDIGILLNRGLLSLELGRAKDAADRFTEALELAPDRLELHYLLADALLAVGDRQAARHQLETYCTLYENLPPPPQNLDAYLHNALRLGLLLTAEDDLPAAEARLQLTANIAATHQHFASAAQALRALAQVQTARGNPSAAAQSLTLAQQAEGYASQ